VVEDTHLGQCAIQSERPELHGHRHPHPPLIGSFLIFELQQQPQSYQDWSRLITGLLLVAIIRVMPGGIWGLVLRAHARAAAALAALLARVLGPNQATAR
jgi:hypothetical protein